jgi:hypothetical protein
MAASINRVNNSLPRLLEWSLPCTWRAKFDLDGYIPTPHSKTRLLEACEVIEKSEVVLEKQVAKVQSGKNDGC